MKLMNVILSCGLVVLGASAAQAAEISASKTEYSPRMEHRLGFYLGVNDPAPAIVGANVAYNVADFLRASAGLGKVSAVSGITIDQNGASTTESSATTIGLAAKAFWPGLSLSPTLGLGWAHVSISGPQGGLVSVDGFSESGSHMYATVGADYQASSGFNAGLGLRQSFKSGVGNALTVSAGWFVDWL